MGLAGCCTRILFGFLRPLEVGFGSFSLCLFGVAGKNGDGAFHLCCRAEPVRLAVQNSHPHAEGDNDREEGRQEPEGDFVADNQLLELIDCTGRDGLR